MMNKNNSSHLYKLLNSKYQQKSVSWHSVVWKVSNKNWKGWKATQFCLFPVCNPENNLTVWALHFGNTTFHLFP